MNKELGLLQPADSKRVADAIIAKIEDGQLNLSSALSSAVQSALHPEGIIDGTLGDAITTAIQRSVHNAVESCVGSKEMFDNVRNAIETGVEARG